MKYRIKQTDNRFYPQHRVLFVWNYILIGDVLLGYYDVWFDNIKDAREFIKDRISRNNHKPSKIIHKLDV